MGDIEAVTAVRNRLGDRLSYLGGLPTAEVFAEAYNAAGFPVYSSAVFNFIPRTAMEFYEAVRTGDRATTRGCCRISSPLHRDPQPVGRLCGVDRQGRGAVVGRSAGPVRPPLTDCTEAEHRELEALIKGLGPQ